MQKELERILPRVNKPARYTGGEYQQTVKDKDKVAVTAGIPLASGVSANVLRVQIVGERYQ